MARVSEWVREMMAYPSSERTFSSSDGLNAKTFSCLTVGEWAKTSQSETYCCVFGCRKMPEEIAQAAICFSSSHNFYHHNRRTLVTVSPYEILLLIRTGEQKFPSVRQPVLIRRCPRQSWGEHLDCNFSSPTFNVSVIWMVIFYARSGINIQ